VQTPKFEGHTQFIMECIKSEIDAPLKYLSQTLDIRKSTAPAENADQFAFNCTDQSNYYTDWRRLKLQVKISKIVGRESVVGIAYGYGLDGPEIESRWGGRLSIPIQTGSGDLPTSYAVCTGSFQRVRRRRHGVDHPPRRLSPRLKKE
jgi:hypothetical protein